MRLICPLIAMLLLFSASARAGDDEENIDCENIRNTVESNFCADKDLQSADKKLNALYKQVLTQISENSLEKPYDRKTWENALRESQRTWMSFRDLDCKGVVPMEWSGGYRHHSGSAHLPEGKDRDPHQRALRALRPELAKN